MTKKAGSLLQDQIIPRLASAIPNIVHFVGCEDAEETIADGTAMAARMIHNSEQAGKKVTRSATGRHGEISAGNVALLRPSAPQIRPALHGFFQGRRVRQLDAVGWPKPAALPGRTGRQ